MIVGYMRNLKKPTHLYTVSALVAKAKGIDIFYFNADDVDMINNKINGRMLINDEWKRVEGEIPKVIDISAFCVKHKKVVSFLREKAFLTDNLKHRLSKEKLQDLMFQDEVLNKYIIKSNPLKSYKDLTGFIEKYKKVVVKPIYSKKGRGIYIIYQKNNQYFLGYQKEEITISSTRLKELYEEKIKGTPHVMQQAIDSRTINDDPFDCRIHLEKNGEGKWTIVNISVRIGIGQTVISNGDESARMQIKPFLKSNFGESWEKINKELIFLGLTLASKIETTRKTELMTMGLDVGIDQSGDLFVFEANSAPGVSMIKSEVALTRADYYKYLLSRYS